VNDHVATVRPDPPPLRIHHLMACAAVAAVQLSLWRANFTRPADQQTIFNTVVLAMTQGLSAVGLTLACFSVYWWFKGFASLVQPGQVLLIGYAFSAIQFYVSLVFMFAIVQNGGRHAILGLDSSSVLSVVLGVGSLLFGFLVPIVFYIWCAWRIADTGPWRLLFVLCALATLFMSPIWFAVMSSVWRMDVKILNAIPYLIRGTALLLIGCLAIFNDLLSKRQRSWTHWAGSGVWLLGQTSTIFAGVFYWMAAI
jgi:hypothetical protein